MAAFKEFGYLAPDSLGFLQHRSLLEYVPSQIRESAKSWSVALTSRAVYFQSSNALLRWSEKLRTMKIWRSEAGFSDLNVFDDALYIRKSGVGFMRMEGDSLRLLPGGEKFSKIVIYALLPYADSRQTPAVLAEVNPDNTYYKTCKPFLAATRTHGLFVFDGASFRPFKTEADAYLIENLIRCGTVLSDGNYALGTLHGGLVVIGPQDDGTAAWGTTTDGAVYQLGGGAWAEKN